MICVEEIRVSFLATKFFGNWFTIRFRGYTIQKFIIHYNLGGQKGCLGILIVLIFLVCSTILWVGAEGVKVILISLLLILNKF